MGYEITNAMRLCALKAFVTLDKIRDHNKTGRGRNRMREEMWKNSPVAIIETLKNKKPKEV